MKRILLVISILAVCYTAPAHSTIVKHSGFMTDTEGLDWIEVFSTIELSFNKVSSEFGMGGRFEGWRYATGIEFNQLIFHATGILPPADLTETQTYLPGSVGFLQFALGLESADNATAGRLGDEAGSGNIWIAEISRPGATGGIGSDLSTTHAQTVSKDFVLDQEVGDPELGSFLVRERISIPETPLLPLMVLGLLGLILSRNRNWGQVQK